MFLINKSFCETCCNSLDVCSRVFSTDLELNGRGKHNSNANCMSYSNEYLSILLFKALYLCFNLAALSLLILFFSTSYYYTNNYDNMSYMISGSKIYHAHEKILKYLKVLSYLCKIIMLGS